MVLPLFIETEETRKKRRADYSHVNIKLSFLPHTALNLCITLYHRHLRQCGVEHNTAQTPHNTALNSSLLFRMHKITNI